MSELLDELKQYMKSCEDDDGYVIESKAEHLVFKAAELIERYEIALNQIVEIGRRTYKTESEIIAEKVLMGE